MNTEVNSYDITANNHGGNARSVEANIDTTPRKANARERIYQAFVEKGPAGEISENIFVPLGIGYNTGTPRISELKKAGRLIVTGRVALTNTGSKADILIADVNNV